MSLLARTIVSKSHEFATHNNSLSKGVDRRTPSKGTDPLAIPETVRAVAQTGNARNLDPRRSRFTRFASMHPRLTNGAALIRRSGLGA